MPTEINQTLQQSEEDLYRRLIELSVNERQQVVEHARRLRTVADAGEIGPWRRLFSKQARLARQEWNLANDPQASPTLKLAAELARRSETEFLQVVSMAEVDWHDDNPAPLSENEEIVEAYEKAWLQDEPPRLDEFLANRPQPEQSLLIELVHVDLENRLKHNQPARVEEYFCQFPSLADDQDAALSLIQAEVAHRQRLREQPRFDELVERFPKYGAELKTLIDTFPPRSLAKDGSTIPYRAGAPSGRDSDKGEETEPLPEIPGYDSLEQIGRGAMGVVVKSRHAALKRLVAIKFPRLDFHLDEGFRERFLREARAAARLRHPHICPIYEVNQYQDRPYIVMAFIHGQTLDQWAKGNRSPREMAELMSLLARSVQYAHANRVIHRDLKPSNVMIDDKTGEPMLMDFGLAKELTDDDRQLTQHGDIMGTPAYMSPEQAAGQIDLVGEVSDVYSLGVILYELLCGQRPFTGNVGEVIRKVQTETPPAPRSINSRIHRDLETICQKAMAQRPADRYPTAEALALDLDRFARGEGIMARRQGLIRSTWRRAARHKGALTSIAALLCLAAVAIGIFASQASKSRQRSDLRDAFEQGLDTESWTAARLLELEKINDRLQKLDPAQAQQDRVRLYQTVREQAIRELALAGKIEPQRQARLEELLKVLGDRNASAADSIRQALERRVSKNEMALELVSPFANAAQALPADRVTIGDNSLIAVAPKRGPPVDDLLLRTACRGDGRIEAEFTASSWPDLKRLGLLLNARNKARNGTGVQDGYALLLVIDERNREYASLAAARSLRAQVSLRIVKREQKQVLLSEVSFPASDLTEGPLRLAFRREGNRLVGQLNESLRQIEFREIFPPAGEEAEGSFGLFLPAGAALASVRVTRQRLPEDPSPMQQGDASYRRANYETALTHYRQQETAAIDQVVIQQAHFKQALCLLQLDREQQARQILRELLLKIGQGRDQWALRAGCQLWRLNLKEQNLDAADTILDTISEHYDFAQLAVLVPVHERQEILKQYSATTNWLLYRPEMVEKLERYRQVSDLVEPSRVMRYSTHVTLMKAYHMADRTDDALALGDRIFTGFLDVYENAPGYYGWIVKQYCWLLRNQGKPQEALEVTQRWIARFDAKVYSKSEMISLVLEKARNYAALGQQQEAEQELRRIVKMADEEIASGSSNPNSPLFTTSLAARLMLGFLLEDQGLSDQAQAIWLEGVRQTKQVFRGHHWQSYSPGVHSLMLASLADQDEIDDEFLEIYWNWQQFFLSGNSSLGKTAQKIPSNDPRVKRILKGALRQMFRSPEGRQWAKRIALRRLSFRQYVHVPMLLGASEVLLQLTLAERNDEQFALAWEFVSQLHTAYAEGKLQINAVQQSQLSLMLFRPNSLSWALISSSFNKLIPLRGRFAYFVGQRCLRRQDTRQARKYFEIAVKDAESGDLLFRLANEELKRLPAP